MICIYIKYDPTITTEIGLSQKFAPNVDVKPKRMLLTIGAWQKDVSVEYSENISEDEIVVSTGLLPNFILPEAVHFEVILEGRNLKIGPIIAFLIAYSEKNLTPEYLNKLKDYFVNYSQINGLIYACSIEGINIVEKTIKGYAYLGQKDNKTFWEEGVFPYPAALFRRLEMPVQIYNDLILNMGDRIFNGYFFNKWETWEWLSSNENLKEHVPYTQKLDNVDVLEKNLAKYDEVYLKQVSSYMGKGILKVRRLEQQDTFIDRVEGILPFATPEEKQTFIKGLVENDYIIQQAVKVKIYQERNYDFRVMMQKDYSKHWQCSGIFCRFGPEGNIATNITIAGFALPVGEALQKALGLSERDAYIKEQEIITLCKAVCAYLDKNVGHYGDLGIDVIIDVNLKIWILEVNKLHFHKFPLVALNDTAMYFKVVTTPFLYAKALTGF